MATTADLYTTVRNVSGVDDKFFGYLTPQGKVLDDGDELTIFGNLQDQERWNSRKQASLEADLIAGVIQILQTPRPILRDLSSVAALSNPSSAATATANSNTGLMVNGTYRVAYTFLNEWGETTIGTSTSANITVVLGNVTHVTLPALPTGALNMSLYVTSANGANSTMRRYATGLSAGVNNMSVAVNSVINGTYPAPPTTNSTEGHATRALKVTDNAVGFADPSWGTFLP